MAESGSASRSGSTPEPTPGPIEGSSTHTLEAGATTTAWLYLVVGLTFGLVGTTVALVRLATADGPLWWLLLALGILGLALIPLAISAWRLPTRDATVQVDPTGLIFTLRDQTTIGIGWEHINAWGTVPRRAMGGIATRSLVAWPHPQVPPEVTAAATPLWRNRNRAWVVEAVDPEADLIAAFVRHAPDQQRTTSSSSGPAPD